MCDEIYSKIGSVLCKSDKILERLSGFGAVSGYAQDRPIEFPEHFGGVWAVFLRGHDYGMGARNWFSASDKKGRVIEMDIPWDYGKPVFTFTDSSTGETVDDDLGILDILDNVDKGLPVYADNWGLLRHVSASKKKIIADIMNEDGVKLLHGTKLGAVDGIFDKGLMVAEHERGVHSTTVKAVAKNVEDVYGYSYGMPFEPRTVILNVPSCLGADYNKVMQANPDDGKIYIPSEFVRGAVDRNANFVPNPNYGVSL